MKKIINTLVQNGTTKKDNAGSFAVLKGEGTDISDVKFLQGRAKRKLITQKMMLSLVNISRIKENPQREK